MAMLLLPSDAGREQRIMIIQCPHCGKSISVNRLGRKRLDIPFKNVYEALQLYQDTGQAAEKLSCSVGYIYNVCKEQGTTPRDVMEIKARKQ